MISSLSDSLSVLVVDDHPAVGSALAALLERNKINVIGIAADARAAVDIVTEHRPTVAIIDLGIGEIDGIELTRRVLAISPTTSVLIYSGAGNLALLYEARDAGARGYLLKESPLDDLIRAIDLIARGGSYIDPSLGNSLIQSRGEGTDRSLTARQIQILRLMSSGQRDSDIAASLCISIETVRAHVKRAMSRLGVTTRSQAVAEAFRRALIT